MSTQPQSALTEVSVAAAELMENSRNSLDFLAVLAMPDVWAYRFPPAYQLAWRKIIEGLAQPRAYPKLALGFPRGFAKTTFAKLALLYVLLFTDRKAILVFSSSSSLAENIIADVMDMLSSENIVKVFGHWRLGEEKDTQAHKIFHFRGRSVNIYAAGSGKAVRGLNRKNARPDVILFDDIQTAEDAESEELSTALEVWMYGTAMGTKSHLGCLFLFLGNMYRQKWSLFKRIKSNPSWTKFIVGGILADGTSLWEELKPVSMLLEEYEMLKASGREDVFLAEVMNDDSVAANKLVDLGAIARWPYSPEEIRGGSFIVIDPATDKKGADAVSIGAFHIYDGTPCLMEVQEGQFSPGDTIRHALNMALKHGIRVIGVESNAYQYSLNYWFTTVMESHGIQGISTVALYSGALSKNTRILSMFRQLTEGSIRIGPQAFAQAASQIHEFNPTKRDNTDGILDLLTYAPVMVQEYNPLITAEDIVMEQTYSSIPVYPLRLTSPF